MKNLHYLFFISLLFSLVLYACGDKEILEERIPNLPETEHNYLPNIQRIQQTIGFVPNISNAEATLGRVLFYDTKLSGNQSVSCASCHKQHLGFADNEALSVGANITTTLRNSPSLSNLHLYNRFFWDNRTSDLGDLIFQPIEDHIEMRFSNEDALISRLEATSYYPQLFEKAYGSTEINKERITAAFTQFLESMISVGSKFDDSNISNWSNLTPSEAMGRELFFGKATCGNCHFDGNLAGQGSALNIGLDMEYQDDGAGSGRFKIPSLRNVALSSPYMHDGRFNTLDEVINHYNNNIQDHDNLSWILQDNTGSPIRLELSDFEVNHLEAFLMTLTDVEYATAERFSNPF